MISYKQGDLLESEAEALVNTVNTVGVMGKGIALQFKREFPVNTRVYEEACRNKTISIGKLLVVKDFSPSKGEKLIINFPTKTDWRKSSEYAYIEAGLVDLVRIISEKNIASVAIPPLGAGNGGLDWYKVKRLIEQYLSPLPVNVLVFEPTSEVHDELLIDKVKLTPARAMLLDVLYDMVSNGEFVSEFAAEKVAYFLQRFGASDQFKLEYKQNFYGPYSGKVRHVLHYLNGSYITGYRAMDKKPFDELGLVGDGRIIVSDFLAEPENKRFNLIADKTKTFLSGFYSAFALELLSTVDFIMLQKGVRSVQDIEENLIAWSNRKKTLFQNPKYLELSIGRIREFLY